MSKKKNQELESLQQKVTELEAQLKRAVADYRNLEQRVAEGRSELTSFVGAQLIRKLLPVLDHLEQVVDLGRPILSERSESKDLTKTVRCALLVDRTLLL